MRTIILIAVCGLTLSLTSCRQYSDYSHRRPRADGIYYEFGCKHLLDCVSLARDRCRAGYTEIEKTSHTLTVRCD